MRADGVKVNVFTQRRDRGIEEDYLRLVKDKGTHWVD